MMHVESLPTYFMNSKLSMKLNGHDVLMEVDTGAFVSLYTVNFRENVAFYWKS